MSSARPIGALHWALALLVSALLHAAALLHWLPDVEVASRSGGGGSGGPLEVRLALASAAVGNAETANSPTRVVEERAPEAEATTGVVKKPPTSVDEARVETRASADPLLPSLQSVTPKPELAALQESQKALRVPDPATQTSPVEPAPAPAESLPAVSSAALPAQRAGSNGLPSSSAGARGGQGRGDANAVSYWQHVGGLVKATLRYPRRARRAGVTGSALVAVRIDRSGQLLASEIARSSGSLLLDRDALATVERAAPFGAVPPSLADRDLAFPITVAYDPAASAGAIARRGP